MSTSTISKNIANKVASKSDKDLIKQYLIFHDAISKRCTLCNNIYKHHNNTTNLKNHLKRKHKAVITQQKDTSENNHVIDNSNSDSSSCSLQIVESDTTNMKTQTLTQKQILIKKAFSRISEYNDGDSKSGQITNAITFMISKDLQPLSIVEDEGFQRLFKIVAPLYTVPSRMTITSHIDEKFVVLSSIVRDKLTEIDNIVLTSDIWTDKYNSKSYICLTAHFIDGIGIESINLGIRLLEEAHNATYLSEIIKSFCHEWNIDLNKVMVMITDSAANIVKAARDTFGQHLPCFAHQLNLVVGDAIKLTPEFKNIVAKVKEIVTFLKRSVKAADELRALQMKTNPNGEHLKVIQESETRWNSMFYMLERFCKLSEFISTVLFKYSDLQMLSHSDITCIKESLKILFPIESVTVEMSGEKYVTGSKVIPIVHCLNNIISRLDPCNAIAEKLKNNIIDQVNMRFYGKENSNQASIEQNYFLSIATLLDPRFKKLHFTSIVDCTKAITRVSNLMKRKTNIKHKENQVDCLEPPLKSGILSVWNFHDELAYNNNAKNCGDDSAGIPIELRQFLNTAVSLRETDPLQEWDKLKYVYPSLFKIARKFLLVSGTSVSSERLYSTAGNIISEKRSKLSSNRVSTLIFLNSLKNKYWEL